MPDASHNTFVLQGAPRAELARLCRQICLAREQKALSPITAEDEFLASLTTVRATYGPDSIDETDLKEIVATEESRVADAAVLAELIAARMTATQMPAVLPTDVEPDAPCEPASLVTAATPIPFSTSSSTPSLSIADLIDGMLMQERRDPRTSQRT